MQDTSGDAQWILLAVLWGPLAGNAGNKPRSATSKVRDFNSFTISLTHIIEAGLNKN